ncbi:MAG: NAD(+)/NADH kinase [Clostridia bacterium]|nr:NAD(+)/NADH kinase [Clostridia bacterium]
MKRAQLLVNTLKPEAQYTAMKVADTLEKIGMVVTEKNPEVIISIGGDGTVLRAASIAARADIPIVGINCGTLGYLNDIEPEETDLLQKLKTDDYTIDELMLLAVTLCRRNGTQEEFLVLNEVLFSRGASPRIADIHLYSDGVHVSDYSADGLIFATPTGSTAYSLSAGGPIIHPSLESITVTPVCPHPTASTRAIVFPGDSMLMVSAEVRGGENACITVDSAPPVDFCAGDYAVIRKSERHTKILRIKNRNFYSVVHKKFNI